MNIYVAKPPKPRLIIPEAVQTSAMDCGPAALKSLLEGFGTKVSYGRLREACQTDVDGTSIDTLEEVAVQLGLDAEQIMLPADYLLLDEAAALPALVVVRQPSGLTHFVVAWRRHGRYMQVMDPAMGRRWLTREQFISQLYVHSLPVPKAAWLEWARSKKFLRILRHCMLEIGSTERDAIALIESACQTAAWQPLARLEAATRTVRILVRSGSVKRGHGTCVLKQLLREAAAQPEIIPRDYYSVAPAVIADGDEEQLVVRGAVLVHISGTTQATSTESAESVPNTVTVELSPELKAALSETPSRPGRELVRFLRADGALKPAAITCALLLATLGTVVEALLLRSMLELPRSFGLTGQRLGIMGALVSFAAALLLLEIPISSGLLRMGRHLESRIRVAFMKKIPRLGDRYFHSRPTSDMAERAHSAHRIRNLPELSGQFVRCVFEFVLTVVGIIWLDHSLVLIAIFAAVVSVGIPLAAQPLLNERDLRLRNHTGALSRFYLDALLGLVPIHTHHAERSLRREHEDVLVEWARSGFSLQSVVLCLEGTQQFVGLGLGAWLLIHHFLHMGEAGGVLLLVYWALNLPMLGQQVGQIAWQYPVQRNLILRALEPLSALEDKDADSVSASRSLPQPYQSVIHRAASIHFEDVSVRAAGHTILEAVDLVIDPGSHVAMVGPSGAGKSSLVGLLLGWHRAASGRVLVDEEPLQGAHLNRVRRETAWVDPAVQLWNRSIFDNLRYGAGDAMPSGELLESTGLRELLPRLPEGLQTEIGESGGLLSGGEGQRVRLARARLKPRVRLAILDEPFRGLDRGKRRDLLSYVRREWQETTMLCITHDVSETLSFPRVLVIEAGRVVEDGPPLELASRRDSRYRALLLAEDDVREGFWASDAWRRLRLENGQVGEYRGVVVDEYCQQ